MKGARFNARTGSTPCRWLPVRGGEGRKHSVRTDPRDRRGPCPPPRDLHTQLLHGRAPRIRCLNPVISFVAL